MVKIRKKFYQHRLKQEEILNLGNQKVLLPIIVVWPVLNLSSLQITIINSGQNINKKLSEGTREQLT